MMRVCVDMGHTPTSPGASGYLDELTEDRRIGSEVVRLLEGAGVEVVDTTAPDWYAYPEGIGYRVAKANGSGADRFVSIHLNAGGGTGSEVLYYPGDAAGEELASRMSAAVAGVLGIADRGAKPRGADIGVIRDTTMTAVLVEVCFVDNSTDAEAYRAANVEDIARAIAGCFVELGEDEDMQLGDRIIDGTIMDGTTYATVGNCLYWAESNAEKAYNNTVALRAEIAALAAAVDTLAKSQGADPEAIAAAVSDAVEKKLEGIKLDVTVE